MSKTFKAFVAEESEPGKYTRRIMERSIDELPPGDVLVKVKYSSLNYKDALVARGHRGISRRYPQTPGIDASGIVEESSNPEFMPGDEILVHGFDLGMNTSGGFAQYIRVPASWLLKIPEGLDLRESMMYGTAGFTAALGIYELQKHEIMPGKGKVLVTGATGGVGSMAVAMLSKLGYDVTASTGKPESAGFLHSLGAKEIISREEVNDKSSRMLLPRLWSGAIENVGGNTLYTVIRSMDHWGTVACCGNVESHLLEMNVYPFILRGVTLTGIDSADRPMPTRRIIWGRIAGEWSLPHLNEMVREVGIEDLDNEISKILAGKQVGRVLVNLD